MTSVVSQTRRPIWNAALSNRVATASTAAFGKWNPCRSRTICAGPLAALWTMQTFSLSRRVHRLSERLRSEPGIVLVKDEVRDGKRVLLDSGSAGDRTNITACGICAVFPRRFVCVVNVLCGGTTLCSAAGTASAASPKSVQMTFQDGTLALSGIARIASIRCRTPWCTRRWGTAKYPPRSFRMKTVPRSICTKESVRLASSL